jgi:ribosomal protein S18 acetylase RimI-like enzyme
MQPNSSSGNAIEVREAVLTDAPELIRLLALLGHEMPAGKPEARLAAFLEGGDRVLVATLAGSETIVGAITLHVTTVLHRPGPIGRFTALIVDESARGKGVGKALVRAAEKRFESQGCALIEVTSNKKRTDAHAFYEGLGYTATSFRFARTLPLDGGTR